jgi:2'-5' RNA ligase
MPRTTRTFVAVEVPEALGAKLSRLQTLLAPECPGVRWTATTPFHLTLAFLGDVDDRDLNDVCGAVAGAAEGFEPFELRIEGVGVFPNPQRPRSVWSGLAGSGVETLVSLQGKVAEAVARAKYPADEKGFRPHVTLGRVKHGRPPAGNLGPLLNQYRGWSAGSFRVDEVVTFASTLTPEGPVYAPLGRALLKGGKHQPSA